MTAKYYDHYINLNLTSISHQNHQCKNYQEHWPDSHFDVAVF